MPRKKKEQIRQEAQDAIAQLVDEAIEETTGERVPGKIVKGLKTPWTAKDIERVFPLCEFTPEETIPVTYQGVKYQLFSGVSMVTPTIIRDIYLEHRRKMRRVGSELAGRGVEIAAGALNKEG